MEWRICIGFPDYEVSECGDVRRVTESRTRKKGSRLRGTIDIDGYIRYSLLRNGNKMPAIPAHKLVADAFIGQAPTESHEVAHNNGSRIFNHYSNLRWATRKENDADTIIHDTARAGVSNGRAKITEQDVANIRDIYRKIKNREVSIKVSELAKHYDVHHATLVQIATGKSWSHLPMPR